MQTLLQKIIAAASTIAALAAISTAAAQESGAYTVPADTPDYIRAAVESPERSAEQRARDANRKPAEILTLSGVKPGDTVIEFAAFGQYYTTMLSEIVGPDGNVFMIDLPYTEKRAGEASRAFEKAHPNTYYMLADYNAVKLPQNADRVFMVLYYHDLRLNDIDTANLNARIYDALKPGGTFIVVDHNAKPGSGRRDTEKLHRIDPAVIAQEIKAAGFELVKRSDLLAHPQDDHSKMVFEPDIRGRTDRTVFKFRKPAN